MPEISNIGNVGGPSRVDRTNRSQVRRSQDAAPASGGDSLQISNQAQEAQRLLSAAQAGEDARPEVVESARNDLNNQTLANDAAINGTAKKIADFMF